MSDPFSIASGAVGIISLGIQLCKQITEYAEAFRDYDADIESIGLKAESLKGPLKQLRDFVEDTQVTESETASDIAEKASQLERHLKRLENRLAKAKPVISDSLKEKLRNKWKNVTYPVRARDALRDIKNDLDSVQSTIQLALTIFNAQQAQKTNCFQENTFKLVQDIHVTLSTFPRNNMPAPSLLKSLGDRCGECASLADPNSQSDPTTQSDDFDLDIEARLSAMTPFTKCTRREDSAKKLFQYYSGWLHRKITLSFSLSNGAGVYSISPVLEVQVYRGEDCWAENVMPLGRLMKIGLMDDPELLQRFEDELISDFQKAISAGEVGLDDIMKDGVSVVEWAFWYVHIWLKRETNSGRYILSQFMRFAIECGYNVRNSTSNLIMRTIINKKWGEGDHILALCLINHGAIVDFLPTTRFGKENLRCLLRRNVDLVDLPEIVKILMLESELELREALQSGNTNLANERIEHLSLLELAVGWPDGVHILLDFGADPSQVRLGYCPYSTSDTTDFDCGDYCDSIIPLLQGGCNLINLNIYHCTSKKARLLLINEYRNRRKRLHDMAQSCLPAGCLAEILTDFSDETILDVHAPRVCTEIIRNGWTIPHSLRCESKGQGPVYHNVPYVLDAWDDLYRAGFRDIDIPDARGLTPLMTCALDYRLHQGALAWLVNKGASIMKRLPFSNTTIAHVVSSQLASHLGSTVSSDMTSSKGMLESLAWAKKNKGTIVLVPFVKDCCTCRCCAGGCTTLLVALRRSNRILEWRSDPPTRAQYFQLLSSLVDLTETTSERDHSIIRLMTFEALELRHTCCIEITTWAPYHNYADSIMDEEEVQSIQDEDQHCYKQLDQLVMKFQLQFDDLDLPIMEFLRGPWHSHMIEVLLTRDSYIEGHLPQTRELGVFLKPTEADEIPKFVNFLGHQVEELDSEHGVSDDENENKANK